MYKQLKQIDNKKKMNNPNKNMSRNPKETFLQRVNTNVQ